MPTHSKMHRGTAFQLSKPPSSLTSGYFCTPSLAMNPTAKNNIWPVVLSVLLLVALPLTSAQTTCPCELSTSDCVGVLEVTGDISAGPAACSVNLAASCTGYNCVDGGAETCTTGVEEVVIYNGDSTCSLANRNVAKLSDAPQTSDWILSASGESCSAACGGGSCVSTSMDEVNSELGLLFISATLALEGKDTFSCSDIIATSNEVAPASGPFCFTQTAQSTCGASDGFFRRICCCGPNCPVS
mmetsp:Transcript_25839/g.64540  ORF Transcript_25839/g.64540 Transcript_25839/m.64540 type:complete len:243 (-) Transcript_25839:1208-1936(-)